jgi:hypothetical protein
LNNPKAFISYSHSDKDFALKIEKDLRESGVIVWIDKYYIQPGESLIQKIFAEGLAEADFFLILLSATSTKSKWVAEELDAAIVRKIEGVIRIIPVLIENCEIPLSLRSLLLINLSENYIENIRNLIKTLHGVFDKPPIGTAPNYVIDLKQSVGGLSKNASLLGMALLFNSDEDTGFEHRYWSTDINTIVPSLTPKEINEIVDELESYGLVNVHRVVGNAPYHFGDISPTYALYLFFKNEGLSYDPESDIKTIASAIAAKGESTGQELRQITLLSPARINRAISYLKDYGYIRVVETIGTAPYTFRSAVATSQTKKLAQNI